MHASKHRFAFFTSLEALKKVKKPLFFSIEDPDLIQRIVSVLRMKSGDFATLFDQDQSADIILESVTKKSVTYSVESIYKTEHKGPEIICFLPLLKREALESAITRLSILGVRKIQLLVSEKSRQSLIAKEFLRLQKIIIAAAEQSKNFAMPELIAPCRLEDCWIDQTPHLFLFDQYGTSSKEIIMQKYMHPITIAFGPEGDFTDDEKKLFLKNNYKLLVLTDSVLRTIDAILLGIGLFKLI
jgi:RsmE family RNA methyltransferase